MKNENEYQGIAPRQDSLEKTQVLAEIENNLKEGQQRWLDTITDDTCMSLQELKAQL